VSLSFRRAGARDWPSIWPIWHEVVAAGDTYTYDPGTESETARRGWVPDPPAETWLACDDGVMLGTYLLRPNQPGQGAHVANAGFMVSATARGRGVGRLMTGHCLQRASELGYLGMQFNAVVETNANAVALWRAFGFTIVGTVPRAFRHPVRGLVGMHVMYRDLAR
jgi:L-amino acid N-acyltransferase YncA